MTKWSVEFSGPEEERPRVYDKDRPVPFILDRMRGTVIRGPEVTHLTIAVTGRDEGSLADPEEFYLNGWDLDSLPLPARCAIEDAVARTRVVADYVASQGVSE
jgi:hypothetical protein